MVEDERMGSTLTCRSTSMNLTVYVRLFITPFSICLVGVAQLTLGRTVSVSLPCPVRWLVNLCLHCGCTFSFSLCITKCLSNQFYFRLQPCLLSSIFSVLSLISPVLPLVQRFAFSLKSLFVISMLSQHFPFTSTYLVMDLSLRKTPIFLYLNLNGSPAVQRCCSSWFLQCNWSING